MRHFKELEVQIDNREEIISILENLKKLKLKDWKCSENQAKEFAEKFNIDPTHIVSFISPYYKNTHPKSDQEVFAGIIHFGIIKNKLKIIDIISPIVGEKLPAHLYNYILYEFIQNIIRPNPKIFKKTFGIVNLIKDKPQLPKRERQSQKGKMAMVIAAKPEKFEIFNKRLKRPIHMIAEEGSGEALFQEGDSIKMGRKNIQYFTPNNIGILLSISDKSLKNAKILLAEIRQREKMEKPLNEIKESSKIICDFIEEVQTCIVFTYTSLEAFVNLSIPDDYEYSEIHKEAGVHYQKKFNGDSIERLLPMKLKIKEILPDIYDTRPIEKEPFYNRFARLEELRNKIIHQKSIEHTDLYKEYFKESIFKICEVSKNIITFFYENCESDFTTNPIWPFIDGKERVFPKSHFKSEQFEIIGSIYNK